MTVPDKAGKGLQIGDQRVDPRPQPVSRRGPEPPLVIGIGRDAPGGEEGARRGEEAVTAGAIPTMQSLGIAFGAATGGLLANAAGLSGGISTATMTAVTDWIYGFSLFPAACVLLAAARLVWLLRETKPQ